MGEEKTITAQQGTVKPPQRLRLSIWASPHLITSTTKISSAKGIIDDISLNNTFSNNLDPKNLTIIFDKKQGMGSKKAVQFYGDVIRMCHAVEVQCLAGYNLAAKTKDAEAFNAWLHELKSGKFAANPDSEIQRVAGLIVQQVNQDFTDTVNDPQNHTFFDGISFDIEHVTDPTGTKALFTKFYQAIADQLEQHQPRTVVGSDKFVGVACGALVDDTHSQTKGAGGAPANALSHDYTMVVGHRNLILRPMCYDAFALILDDPATGAFHSSADANRITQWHNDVMDYAASKGVPKTAFQLGIKIFDGGNNKPTKVPKKDAEGHMLKPDGTIAGTVEEAAADHFTVGSTSNFDGVMKDPKKIIERCKELRTRGMGLIIFAFGDGSTTFWQNIKSYNDALNPVNPANASAGTLKPHAVGAPAQWPHTLMSLARMAGA